MSTGDFARAADQLQRGRLGAADGWCRRGLATAPTDPAGLNLLGCIAALAGLHAAADDAFTAALPLAAARDNLELLAGEEPMPARTGPGFVLIKSWGYGFCAELAHVLGGLLLAGITGRTPLVHWGRRCLFSGGKDDGFGHFFAPVSNVTLADLKVLEGASLFPAGWSLETLECDRPVVRPGEGPAALEFLARPETILVCDQFLGVADLAPWIPSGHRLHGLPLPACFKALVDTYLHPLPEITAAAAAFRARHLAGGPVLAVHLRGSDKVLEVPDMDEANQRSLALFEALPADWRILLLTDDTRFARRLRERHGERLVMTDCRRSADATGIHYHAGEDGPALGREVLTDLLLALEADRFLGNGRSNVSALIAVLRTSKGRDSTLVLENQLLHHSCFL